MDGCLAGLVEHSRPVAALEEQQEEAHPEDLNLVQAEALQGLHVGGLQDVLQVVVVVGAAAGPLRQRQSGGVQVVRVAHLTETQVGSCVPVEILEEEQKLLFLVNKNI